MRWHKAGLLPRPTRRSLGRGRGMESRYPAIALSQVLAITWFFQQHRRLEEVRWALWGFGFDVTEGVRTDLLKRLEAWHTGLRRGYRDFCQDRRPNPVNDLAFGRSPAWFGSTRRRVGKQNAETVGRIGVELLLGALHSAKVGAPRPIERYDKRDFELLLRATEFSVEAPTGRHGLATIVGGVPDALVAISESVSFPVMRRLIRASTADDLCSLRDEAQTIFGWLLGSAMKQAKQPEAPRLHVRWGGRTVTAALRWDRSFLPRDAFYLWVVLRRSPLFGEWLHAMLNGPGVPSPRPPALIRIRRKSQTGTHPKGRRPRGVTRG